MVLPAKCRDSDSAQAREVGSAGQLGKPGQQEAMQESTAPACAGRLCVVIANQLHCVHDLANPAAAALTHLCFTQPVGIVAQH